MDKQLKIKKCVKFKLNIITVFFYNILIKYFFYTNEHIMFTSFNCCVTLFCFVVYVYCCVNLDIFLLYWPLQLCQSLCRYSYTLPYLSILNDFLPFLYCQSSKIFFYYVKPPRSASRSLFFQFSLHNCSDGFLFASSHDVFQPLYSLFFYVASGWC